MGVARIGGDVGRAVLAYPGAGAAERLDRGVRLGGQRQVDRRLGEVQGALRQADVLHGVRGGDGDLERAGVRVADVLAREDHHPPGDEAGVLAALEHRRQVEQGGIGVGAARGLDPGRDRVVVEVAALVVEDGLALQRVLGHADSDRAVPDRVAGELERGQRDAGVAAGAGGEELERVVLHLRRLGDTALVAERAPQQRQHLVVAELSELVDAAAGQKRRVDLEEGVLRRGPDQDDEALLDRRQQRVLLRLVEAVDLVEEEHRRLAVRAAPVLRPLEHVADLLAARADRGGLLEGGARTHGEHARQRGLAAAGRPVEDHRVGSALLDRRAQGRAAPEQVLLTDELPERAGPHARRERLLGNGHSGAPPRLVLKIEEPLHKRILAAKRTDVRCQGLPRLTMAEWWLGGSAARTARAGGSSSCPTTCWPRSAATAASSTSTPPGSACSAGSARSCTERAPSTFSTRTTSRSRCRSRRSPGSRRTTSSTSRTATAHGTGATAGCSGARARTASPGTRSPRT